jgi:hypothetical protein
LPLRTPVRVAGSRRSIEELFQTGKDQSTSTITKSEAGPPGTASSPWPCSPGQVLTIPTTTGTDSATEPDLIALTVAETRRLLNILITTHTADPTTPCAPPN